MDTLTLKYFKGLLLYLMCENVGMPILYVCGFVYDLGGFFIFIFLTTELNNWFRPIGRP